MNDSTIITQYWYKIFDTNKNYNLVYIIFQYNKLRFSKLFNALAPPPHTPHTHTHTHTLLHYQPSLSLFKGDYLVCF